MTLNSSVLVSHQPLATPSFMASKYPTNTPTDIQTNISTNMRKWNFNNSNSKESDLSLITTTMNPIAEPHSIQMPSNIAVDNSNSNQSHNSNLTHSPSQPRLFNNKSIVSNPLTPYNNMIYYPDYTIESYFSATSSTYNTPKSGGNITGAHAHGLLATWNEELETYLNEYECDFDDIDIEIVQINCFINNNYFNQIFVHIYKYYRQ